MAFPRSATEIPDSWSAREQSGFCCDEIRQEWSIQFYSCISLNMQKISYFSLNNTHIYKVNLFVSHKVSQLRAEHLKWKFRWNETIDMGSKEQNKYWYERTGLLSTAFNIFKKKHSTCPQCPVFQCTRAHVREARVGFSMKFWLHCHLSFLYFCSPFTSLENLKCAIGGELFFLSEWICRHQLCLKGKTYIKDNVKMAMFWINFFLALYNPNLNL